ncbi:macrophage mannose receptor 1 [Elysia marginata]|uniref:Macrophage mannose receptor 1 n=1 Tax=Elysia marginata TaxID=1093978 RepID=A0AAV4HKK4_9GAST|nr:macrophage mannose receptor 1 [Elysia marginata]
MHRVLIDGCIGYWPFRHGMKAVKDKCVNELYSQAESSKDVSNPDEHLCNIIDSAERCMNEVEFRMPLDNCDMEYRKFLFRSWPFALRPKFVAARKICHAKCPDGWSLTPDADHCLKLFEEEKNWNDASLACGVESQLAHIGNPQIKSFVLGLIENLASGVRDFWTAATYGNGSNIFTTFDENKRMYNNPRADVCSMVSPSAVVLAGCQKRQGFICETPPTGTITYLIHALHKLFSL